MPSIHRLITVRYSRALSCLQSMLNSSASSKDVCFTPLYAYGNHNGTNEFSAGFQLASGLSITLTIPYIFRFQSVEGKLEHM
jgi:hypothetical protein